MFNNKINKEITSVPTPEENTQQDVLANIKTLDKTTETYIRVLPRVSADGVIETEEKQLISRRLKESIKNKQDKLGYIPLNKAGDEVLGHLYLKPDQFTDNKQAVSKGYVDKKIEQIINSAPATLDTLYELANALGNDPNFASTITNLIANKLDKTEVVPTKTPNKVLRLDGNGDLITDLKGNADTSSKLQNPFTLSLEGLASGNVSIDGSSNVSLNVQIQQASEVQPGILSPEDYLAFKNGTGSSSENAVGAKFHNFTANDFYYIAEEKLYSIIYSYGYTDDIIGLVQVYEQDKKTGDFFETVVDIIVNRNIVTIKSLKPFDGRIVYNLISSKHNDIPSPIPPVIQPQPQPQPEPEPEPEVNPEYTDWQEYTLTYGQRGSFPVRMNYGFVNHGYGSISSNTFINKDGSSLYINTVAYIAGGVWIIFTSTDVTDYHESIIAPYDFIEIKYNESPDYQNTVSMNLTDRGDSEQLYIEGPATLNFSNKFTQDYNAGIKTITFRMRGHYKTV